jgi:hypothetical protein
MTDNDLDIENPLAWFPVDRIAETSEGMTGVNELSFNRTVNPLSMSAHIPLPDTNGTNELSYCTKYASDAALSFRQGRGECSNDPSDSQEPTARSLQGVELRNRGPNLSKASLMIKDRKPSRYAPRYPKVTKAKPSQKNTIENFNYEIAEPISYCSLELFAIWVEEYHWLDGDVRTSTFRYRFIGGALCHFKEWALKRERRNDDLVKICALCFWTYGSFYPKRVRKQQAACRCILVTEEKRQGNPLITQSTRYYPADEPRDL